MVIAVFPDLLRFGACLVVACLRHSQIESLLRARINVTPCDVWTDRDRRDFHAIADQLLLFPAISSDHRAAHRNLISRIDLHGKVDLN